MSVSVRTAVSGGVCQIFGWRLAEADQQGLRLLGRTGQGEKVVKPLNSFWIHLTIQDELLTRTGCL